MKVLVLGAGVVGQATGKAFIEHGHTVTFADIKHSTLERLSQEGYNVTDLSKICDIDCEVIFLCLPTPFQNGEVNLNSFKEDLPYLGEKLASCKNYHLIVVKSTVPPNTTQGLIIPTLRKLSGKRLGADFGVCVNPEFLREKSNEEDALYPWVIVIGALDEKSSGILEKLYNPFNTPVIKTNLRTAEMIKYVSNLYNATKISFTNEIWQVSNKLGIDGDLVMSAVVEAAEGMWNPQYGTKGGYPYTGSCLPKDTLGFLSYAKNELNMDMPLLEATIKVNQVGMKQ